MERPVEPLVLGRYRLDRRLGAGGFGVVWQAWDERLHRPVAVKVMPPEEAGEGGGRAGREARAAARLNHPAIVAVYELAADDEATYLVSELVQGRTLADLVRARELSDRDVARIGVAMCEALQHAHGRGVIHRDVKPQNVMVVADPASGEGFAKLADFGVAHLAGGDRFTRTGDVVGTLAYMAPEQAEGAAVTAAADVYSLSLTLYEAWTGSNPVRARSPAATARRLGRKLPRLARRRRDLPLELCAAVDDALARDPRRRPTPKELGSELGRALPDLSDEGGLAESETLEPAGVSTHGPGRHLLASWAARLGAGMAAGSLVLAALTQFGSAPAPGAFALAAALGVALLPRAGWVAASVGALAWLAVPAGRPGVALLVLAAIAPTPLLLPRAGVLWSAPAAAPLLGAIGLAAAFPAIAGLTANAWRRAGLAASGLLWLVAAEVLTERTLLAGPPDGAHSPLGWEGSVTAAASDALAPILLSGAPVMAVVWAGFAVALPLLVRGRLLVLDILGAGVWAAGLVAAQAGVVRALDGAAAVHDPRGAVVGGLLGAFAAVCIAGARARPDPAEAPRAAQPATAA